MNWASLVSVCLPPWLLVTTSLTYSTLGHQRSRRSQNAGSKFRARAGSLSSHAAVAETPCWEKVGCKPRRRCSWTLPTQPGRPAWPVRSHTRRRLQWCDAARCWHCPRPRPRSGCCRRRPPLQRRSRRMARGWQSRASCSAPAWRSRLYSCDRAGGRSSRRALGRGGGQLGPGCRSDAVSQ